MAEFYHEAGKGSRIRSSENKKKFDEGFDRIFGKQQELPVGTCQKKCKLEGDVCSGCGRTIEEIKSCGN